MKRRYWFCLFIIIIFTFGCSNDVDSPKEEVVTPDPTQKVYDRSLWGEWVRMDKDERWFINSYSVMVDDVYKRNADLTLLSDGIIKVQEDGKVFCLYSMKTADSRITGTLRDLNNTRSIDVGSVLGDLAVKIENKKDKNDTIHTKTDAEGKFEADGVILGNEYEVSVEGRTPVLITPSWDGEDIGTISFCDGINFKVAIDREIKKAAYCAGSDYEYYCDLKITNVGNEDCLAAVYELMPEEGLHVEVLEEFAGNPILGTIEVGATKILKLKISSDDIPVESCFRKLNISIRDSINDKTWLDSVSIKFYRHLASFAFNGTNNISGVVKCRDYTLAFHDMPRVVLTLPKLDDEYVVILSGADAQTEAIYSIGVNAAAGTELIGFKKPEAYEPNNTYEQAAVITDTEPITAYLHKNDIDYYKFSVNGFSTSRIGQRGLDGGVIFFEEEYNKSYMVLAPRVYREEMRHDKVYDYCRGLGGLNRYWHVPTINYLRMIHDFVGLESTTWSSTLFKEDAESYKTYFLCLTPDGKLEKRDEYDKAMVLPVHKWSIE